MPSRIHRTCLKISLFSFTRLSLPPLFVSSLFLAQCLFQTPSPGVGGGGRAEVVTDGAVTQGHPRIPIQRWASYIKVSIERQRWAEHPIKELAPGVHKSLHATVLVYLLSQDSYKFTFLVLDTCVSKYMLVCLFVYLSIALLQKVTLIS